MCFGLLCPIVIQTKAILCLKTSLDHWPCAFKAAQSLPCPYHPPHWHYTNMKCNLFTKFLFAFTFSKCDRLSWETHWHKTIYTFNTSYYWFEKTSHSPVWRPWETFWDQHWAIYLSLACLEVSNKRYKCISAKTAGQLVRGLTHK